MTLAETTRQPCLVPGCRRTRLHAGGEWICGDHWRLTDRHVRRTLFRAVKRFRHGGEKAETFASVARQCWRRLKTQAIERAGGLA